MATLTVEEGASPSSLVSANQEIEIEGEGGRRFTIKRPPHIVLVWNLPALTSNGYQLMAAENALWVSKIDGEALPLPQTEAQLKERIQRVLGASGEGLQYVQVAREEIFKDGAETQEQRRERIKKKLVTPESGNPSGL